MTRLFNKAVTVFLLALIYAYKLFISPYLGRNCRFEPGCSTYAIMAIKGHGPVRGGWLALKRILRCHPWSKGGCDLPPEAHRH